MKKVIPIALFTFIAIIGAACKHSPLPDNSLKAIRFDSSSKPIPFAGSREFTGTGRYQCWLCSPRVDSSYPDTQKLILQVIADSLIVKYEATSWISRLVLDTSSTSSVRKYVLPNNGYKHYEAISVDLVNSTIMSTYYEGSSGNADSWDLSASF